MPPDAITAAILQYGALGLLGAVLYGAWKVASRVGDAAVNALERHADAFDAIRQQFAQHDVADAVRHEQLQRHITSEVDRVRDA